MESDFGPTTSQADEMMKKSTEPGMYGVVIDCEWCRNKYMGNVPHDCYEKRNGIRMDKKALDDWLTREPSEELDHYVAKIKGGTDRTFECEYDELEPLSLHELRIRRTYDEGMYTLEIANPPTDQARRILMDVLPEVLELFLSKNKDYGDQEPELQLGAAAEFVEMWRKVLKLRSAIWYGNPLTGEQPAEILKDLIGHCLLALVDFSTELE